MATDVVRYGVSLLDMKYLSDAQNDEVLIRGQDGRIFYKRDDGRVVTHNSDYNKNTLYDTMNVIHGIQKLTSTDFLVYNTIDVTGLGTLNSSAVNNLNLGVAFPVSKNEDGFYIRIHGSEETNDAISLAKKIYAKSHTINKSDATISVTLTTGSQTKSVTVNANFNELTFVPVNITADSTITVNSVKFVMIPTVLSSLTIKEKEILNEINFGNSTFEASCIDLVTFVSSIDSVIVKSSSNDKVRLNMISELSDYLAYSVKNNIIPFVISTDKPNFKCIWAQQLTEPETFN